MPNLSLRVLAVAADLLETTFHFTIAFGVFCFVAGETAGKAFFRWQADWIGTEATWPPKEPAVAPVAPMVHPAALMAEELMALSGRQLMALCGSRKKHAKAHLVGWAVAC